MLASVAFRAAGCVMVILSVEIHPFVSVTVTLYNPALRPDISSVFAVNRSGPVHEKPNGLLPVAVRSTAPVLSL